MVHIKFHNGFKSPGSLNPRDWDGMQSEFNKLSDDELYEKDAPAGYTVPLTAKKNEIGYMQLEDHVNNSEIYTPQFMGNGVTIWLDGTSNQYSDSKAETATNVQVNDSDIYRP